MSQKYKDQNQLHIKKIMILVAIILTLALFIFIILLSSIQKKEEEKQIAISTGKFNSIKDILEYYGCQYKSQKKSELENFDIDIYTTFKYDLYDNENSNEEFYNNVINTIAKFLNYTNFRMIDESKEEKIEIQVIGDGSKIQTIFINGIEDYFIYMDSQISLSKYKELKTTEISIQSPELINCIQNNWNSNTNFGTRETIFQNYDIYFDEGIQIRKISGKIYNIIFTKNYVKSVVNGFTVGEKHDIIIDRLGNPTFQNEDGSIIGYKSKDIYVFFEKDQISIYRNTKETGFDEFFKLTDKFLNHEYTLLDFMNELTYLWPDYEKYTYDAETVFLSYPNKGIDVKINYDNMDGIILYNNIGVAQNIVNQYLKHTEFVAQLQVDNVYNAEVRRMEIEKSKNTKCKEYKEQFEKEDDRNRGQIYDYYAEIDSNKNIIAMYFISRNEQFVDCELHESINSYIWINETCLLYGINGKGIYFYDLKKQTKGVIVSGEDLFEIKSYENNILKYDDREIQVIY